jgi:hypothetical protein
LHRERALIFHAKRPEFRELKALPTLFAIDTHARSSSHIQASATG